MRVSSLRVYMLSYRIVYIGCVCVCVRSLGVLPVLFLCTCHDSAARVNDMSRLCVCMCVFPLL